VVVVRHWLPAIVLPSLQEASKFPVSKNAILTMQRGAELRECRLQAATSKSLGPDRTRFLYRLEEETT
jgi:hypothetical protein